MISPELECRVQDHFEALQSQAQLLLLAVSESVASQYLVGPTLSRRLCETKMAHDIVKLEIEMTGKQLSQSVLKEELSVFEKIGTIGTRYLCTVYLVQVYRLFAPRWNLWTLLWLFHSGHI